MLDMIWDALEWVMDGFRDLIDSVKEIEFNATAAVFAVLGTALFYWMMNVNPLWEDSIFFTGWRLWLTYALLPIGCYMGALIAWKKYE